MALPDTSCRANRCPLSCLTPCTIPLPYLRPHGGVREGDYSCQTMRHNPNTESGNRWADRLDNLMPANHRPTDGGDMQGVSGMMRFERKVSHRFSTEKALLLTCHRLAESDSVVWNRLPARRLMMRDTEPPPHSVSPALPYIASD